MSTNSLYALVLAAGQASRYGSTKQLAVLDGEALVARAIRSAEAICGARTLLVTGNDWQKVASACAPLQGFMLQNPRFRDGMSTSITQGIRSIRQVAQGVLLMLADQPLVGVAHLQDLVAAWTDSPESICASGYAGTSGPPVIFPAGLFTQLLQLEGDCGARAVIAANSDRLITIDYEDAAIDIDTPADLEKI